MTTLPTRPIDRTATALSPQLPPTDWTDQELLARMLVREGKAWREFHRRFDRLIFRCIHKVTARFRAVLSEEDVQEIYAQFLVEISQRDMRKLRAFDPERGNKLGSWLGMLATNTAWDYLRKVARRPPCADLGEAQELRSEAADPFDDVASREHLGLVRAAVRELSEKDRRFMQLYFVEGLSPDEVAARMRVSVKTVYSKKHKIRARLRRAVSAQL